MRRIVVIAPEILSEPGQDSFLSQNLPGLSRLSEVANVGKVAEVPSLETPEALLLGMKARTVELRQGPLTVSGLGFDPPERSTHFHLSLLSVSDGRASVPTLLPRPGELEQIMGQTARLNSKLLTTLIGERFDHGLVWEQLGDLDTTPVHSMTELGYAAHLPQGDGETLLRRYIDDSVNMLSELDVNIRREDEGLPPFNLLWPWGHGRRTAVPNLALLRGEPTWVESGSMRLAGLTRLAGYRHVPRSLFGEGLRTQFASIRNRVLEKTSCIVFFTLFADLRRADIQEEMGWAVAEFDREFLVPLLRDVAQSHDRLTLVLPGPLSGVVGKGVPASAVGLVATYEPGMMVERTLPIDERTLEERGVATRDLSEIVAAGLLLSE